MGSILEYCVVTRANIPTKISVQQALRNRREFMSCPECGGRVRAHDAYKADSPRQHFEHFPPTPKDCQWSVRAKATSNRAGVSRSSAVPPVASSL
jgi:hypothetical protein